jgi:hypothetical protein
MSAGSEWRDWPALHRAVSLPERMDYERGVWGKVHGATTDFRWIARSRQFENRSTLADDLNLGNEDMLTYFQAWRNTGDRCYAVNIYPSRAVDAAGRRGFLEKQILAWRRPPEVPAALGALLLLPAVAAMSDSIWWDSDLTELRMDPSAVFSIVSTAHEALAVSEDVVGIAIERGRQALREALDPHSLARCYDDLLTDRRPAYLRGLQKPLSAEALAALLLALPSDLANRISIAGWVPASRPSFEELAGRWDLIVVAPDHPITTNKTIDGGDARRRSRALLNTEFVRIEEQDAPRQVTPARVRDTHQRPKPFRPGVTMDLTPLPIDAEPIIAELHRFALDVNRRWMTAETLAATGGRRHFRSDEPSAQALLAWITEMSDAPPHVDATQWRIKTDLLRSAAIVLIPEPATVDQIRPLAHDSTLPMLYFAGILQKLADRERLADIGEPGLRWLFQQSMHTARRFYVIGFLEEWRSRSTRPRPNVRHLIDEVLPA